MPFVFVLFSLSKPCCHFSDLRDNVGPQPQSAATSTFVPSSRKSALPPVFCGRLRWEFLSPLSSFLAQHSFFHHFQSCQNRSLGQGLEFQFPVFFDLFSLSPHSSSDKQYRGSFGWISLVVSSPGTACFLPIRICVATLKHPLFAVKMAVHSPEVNLFFCSSSWLECSFFLVLLFLTALSISRSRSFFSAAANIWCNPAAQN